jgi:EmrB/QacA subfamily drug resistance transporter
MSQNPEEVVSTTTTPTSGKKSHVLALFAIIMTMLLTALDQTIVNPALPRIVEELQGFSLFAWVSTAYLLTSTAAIPIAGKLGDMFGRKPVLLISVVIFLLGSLLSGAAPSMLWLIIFRGLQGIGGGALQANDFTTIAEIFPDPARRARWQGFIGGVFGLSSVIGPALGGFITDTVAWRWIFYLNLPVGALAIIGLLLYLPYNKGDGSQKIDWWGAATITGSVSALLLALTFGGQPAPKGYPWLSPQISGLLIVAVALAGLFIWIEAKTAQPIMPLHLFKSTTVKAIAAISFSLGVIMLGALYYIPLFVQVVGGQTAASSGAITTPLAITMVITNILAGQFIAKVGTLKPLIIAGALVSVTGVSELTLLNVTSQGWEVTIVMIVIGLGLGLIMPISTIAIQESIDYRDLGAGISSVQFFRSIGSTVGVAIIGSVVTTGYVNNINAASGVSALSVSLLEVVQEPQNLLNKQLAANLPNNIIGAMQQSLSEAVHGGFLIVLAVSLLTFLITLFIPAIRIKTLAKNKTEQAILDSK